MMETEIASVLHRELQQQDVQEFLRAITVSRFPSIVWPPATKMMLHELFAGELPILRTSVCFRPSLQRTF